MSDAKTYPPSAEMAANAHVDAAKYDAMYAASLADPDAFWGEQGKRIDWIKPYTQVKDVDYTLGNVSINWYADGQLNVSANCIDRHLAKRGDQTAIIWEPDSPEDDAKHITYKELHAQTCKMANILRDMGVTKGDRVIIYMPMIPEAAYAMLACARIGAIHSIVFAGFSPDALAARVQGSEAKVVITADEAPRGGRATPLKANADKALANCDASVKCLVVRRTGGDVAWDDARDVDYTALSAAAADTCEPEAMDAEDPLFILYTSGSTGMPKGVVHTTGGYIVYAALTHETTFDYHDGDVFWCTADVGWVTGHSYIVYGPLANGATTVMFEGVPTYPDASRFWQVCDKHQVNQFYTAPTALRALMGQGNSFVESADLSSLKLLGTVGEPINPEAWNWYNEVVGKGRCPIVDTWWQTETGGHLMTPLPGAHAMKPGSAMKPFFGIKPVVLEPTTGEEIEGNDVEGVLCIADSWPGQMRHRMGTAEVESALVAHEKVAEAAVVGYPHDIKGQGIYCYVTLMGGETATDDLRKELETWVRTEIGPIAKPDMIQWAPGLPKTRSGKIMRRILRKIAENDYGALGDTSTLADPSVVDDLIENRMNR
jgi:acetyl-CoA synthetase